MMVYAGNKACPKNFPTSVISLLCSKAQNKVSNDNIVSVLNCDDLSLSEVESVYNETDENKSLVQKWHIRQ
jgi:hypothetical protein